MSDYVNCPGCDKRLKRTTTKPEKYRQHKDCDFSRTEVVQCQSESTPSDAPSPTASSATSSPADAKETVVSATSSPPSSSDPATSDASTRAIVDLALPGVEEYTTVLDAMSTEQREAFKAKVEANLTPSHFSQPADHYDQPTLFSQPAAGVNQSGSGPESASPSPAFSQPAGRRSEAPAEEMTDLGKELTARFKEMFYAYDNRRTSDNRSAQTTMGPSEMGTPCDRRLALSLMRMPSVNPGGDGWAAFVGTCIHVGLAEMFLWANHGTGRFAVEQRLEYDSDIVPKGTADLIDRTLFMLDDHKCQGRWSRNKLKSVGPIPTYRVQAHVYAFGARKRGERIEHVAIISWPRDESTLDDLYVWTEPYRPDIVKKAFERVEDINQSVIANQEEMRRIRPQDGELEVKARVAANYNVADDCRFCPFYLPNARSIMEGCNGKR